MLKVACHNFIDDYIFIFSHSRNTSWFHMWFHIFYIKCGTSLISKLEQCKNSRISIRYARYCVKFQGVEHIKRRLKWRVFFIFSPLPNVSGEAFVFIFCPKSERCFQHLKIYSYLFPCFYFPVPCKRGEKNTFLANLISDKNMYTYSVVRGTWS